MMDWQTMASEFAGDVPMTPDRIRAAALVVSALSQGLDNGHSIESILERAERFVAFIEGQT